MPELPLMASRSRGTSRLSSPKVSLGKEKKAHAEAQVCKQTIFVLNDLLPLPSTNLTLCTHSLSE